jgi:glycerol-3-phosphate dehydrogenase subunit C
VRGVITEEFPPVSDTVEDAAPVEACTKCTACNTVCPVAQATDIFRGPKALGPEAERFRSPQEPAVTAGLDLCSGCKLCEVTCPSQVTIQGYIRRAQNKGARERGRTLRDWVLGHTRLLGRLGSLTAPLANLGNRTPVFRLLLERVVGIHRNRPLPRYQWQTFERWHRRHPPAAGARRKVAYFYGCWVNYNERRLGEMVVLILERNGIEVVVPKQQCCGIPAVVNANMDLARRYGEQNVRLLTPVAEQMDIVASSTSCGLTLKHDYAHLMDIPGSQTLGSRVYDICEYLWMLHEKGELNLDFETVQMRVLYHAPCHLKSHGMGYPAMRLLRLVPGVTVEEVDEGCCGISGTFGVKVEKYDLSMKIGSRLFAAVKAAGSDAVLADCETCRMQVEHGAGATSTHPVEILARAYGQTETGVRATRTPVR